MNEGKAETSVQEISGKIEGEGDQKQNTTDQNKPSPEYWKELDGEDPEYVKGLIGIMSGDVKEEYRKLEEDPELNKMFQECTTCKEKLFELLVNKEELKEDEPSKKESFKKGYYRGQWFKGKRHGLGTMYWEKNVVYNGYWKDDVPSSPGVLMKLTIKENSKQFLSVYSGKLLNFMRHGKGKFYYIDYLASYVYTYDGPWDYDLKNGKGIEHHFREEFSIKSQDTYDGEFINDKREGYGELDGGKYVYKGLWKSGKMHGKGSLTFKEPNKNYEGEMALGYMHGKGKLKDNYNNREYVGEFQYNMFHGKGTMRWLNDNRWFDGDWKFGVQEGDGEFVTDDDRGEGKVKIKGKWQNGIYGGNLV